MKPFTKIASIVLGVLANFFFAVFNILFPGSQLVKEKPFLYQFNGKVDTVNYNDRGGPNLSSPFMELNMICPSPVGTLTTRSRRAILWSKKQTRW